MKLFRQKDELFEVMNKAADRRRPGDGGSGGPGGSGTSGAHGGSMSGGERPAGGPGLPRKTATTHRLPRPDGGATVASPGEPRSGSGTASRAAGSSTSTSTSTSNATSIGSTGSTPRIAPARPRGSVGACAVGASRGDRSVGSGAPPSVSASFSSPFVGGPVGAGKPGELVEVDGDALVVLDDGWDEGPEPGRLLALRLDTAVVGGLLVLGLLATAFLVGRTSSPASPDGVQIVQKAAGEERRVAVEAVEPSMNAERQSSPLQARSAANGATTTPGSLPAGANPGAASAPSAGFRPGSAEAAGGGAGGRQPATEAGAGAPERSAKPGKFEMRVVTTTAEKAAEVARWLNTDPRSPIIGRNDLEATAKGGSVRIVGFAEREGDLMTRVRATTDPTNRGSDTFHDAYYVAVQAPGR